MLSMGSCSVLAPQSKRYQCDQCGMEFSRLHNLKTHRLIHFDIRPYECGQCTHRFRRKHDLERHLVAHAGLKPYVCVACTKGFTRMDALNKHYRAEPLCKQEMELQRGQGVLRTTAVARQVKTHLGRLHGLVNGEPVNGRCARGTLTAAAVAGNVVEVSPALAYASSSSNAAAEVNAPAFTPPLRSTMTSGSDTSSIASSTSSQISLRINGTWSPNSMMLQEADPTSHTAAISASPYFGRDPSFGPSAPRYDRPYEQYSPVSLHDALSVSPPMKAANVDLCHTESSPISPISLPPISTFDFPSSTTNGSDGHRHHHHSRHNSASDHSSMHYTSTMDKSSRVSMRTPDTPMQAIKERGQACSSSSSSSSSASSSVSSSPPPHSSGNLSPIQYHHNTNNNNNNNTNSHNTNNINNNNHSNYYSTYPQPRDGHGLPPPSLRTTWPADRYGRNSTPRINQSGSPISPLRSPMDASYNGASFLPYATITNDKSSVYSSSGDSFSQLGDDSRRGTMPCTPVVSPRSLMPSQAASPNARIYHAQPDSPFNSNYSMHQKFDHFELPASVASTSYPPPGHTNTSWSSEHQHHYQQQHHEYQRHYSHTNHNDHAMQIDEPTESLPMSPVDAAQVMVDWTRHQRHQRHR